MLKRTVFVRNLHALPDVTLADLKREAASWSARHAPGPSSYDHGPRKGDQQVLKVGFLSGRFCRHAVGFLSVGVLDHLDPTKIEPVLFPTKLSGDDYWNRFTTAASAVHDLSAVNDEDAADLIHRQGIHILIDMAGHSADGRLGVMMRRPAPVQAKWVGGQHGTTGLKAIDCFLTAEIETPHTDDPYFTETPDRLPNSYAVYTPPPDAPAVCALPTAQSGSVTFGSFNNIAKMSEPTLDAWAEVLKAVAGSRLVLKHFALAEERTRDRIRALFSARGVAPERLDMHSPSDQADHLTAYHGIHITLDPFPWSGCVTTCESLWMGVPVLTLPGVAFCHRHSASFLTTLGLTDWIARDVDDYVAKAVGFANRPDHIAELRQSLRARMRSSALCDAPRFARDFERALFHMWRSNV